MRSEKPDRSLRSDPAFNLLDSALHDGAVVLDAYARFVTTAIGTLLFPYAVMAPPQHTERNVAEPPARASYGGIVQALVALVIGMIIGRRLFSKRPP